MLDTLSTRQQEIMRLLLHNKAGLTIEALLGAVSITRTAVRQHLQSLESMGLVAGGPYHPSGGRPKRCYVLTPKGLDLFPKQYSWFSSLLLAALADRKGDEGLEKFLESLAGTVAEQLRPRLAGLSGAARYREIVSILNELSFDAALASGPAGQPEVTASNCVYHHLAARFPQVCAFDRALLSHLSGKAVDQRECIVKGGSLCRFGFGQRR